MGSRPAVLEAKSLAKQYPVRGATASVHAVNEVSLSLVAGETLGILGESGCGKSTLARLLVRLEEPTSGELLLDGIPVSGGRGGRQTLRTHRRAVQMVFQDPYSSLNPRHRVGDIVGTVLDVHGLSGGRRQRAARVGELFEQVGLDEAHARRFPHELSGGQRQRVGIARALAVGPRVLVLDEPVSALDVSVRAEIMNLLARLRDELDLAYVFISHDVSMVRHIADRVAVMYLGRVVETGTWLEVVDAPAHPYTRGLSAAVPVPDPTFAVPLEATVVGEVPSPVAPPSGCTFHPRCPLVEPRCSTVEPGLIAEADRGSRLVACHVVNRG